MTPETASVFVLKDYDNFLKDLDNNLLKDEEVPFIKFYEMIKFSKNKVNYLKKIHEDSINTWILMEACKESAKITKHNSIKNFKKFLL